MQQQWLALLRTNWNHSIQALANYIPTLIGALLLLITGWLIAKCLRYVIVRCGRLLERLLKKLHIDLNHSKEAHQRQTFILTAVATLVYWIVLLFFLTASLQLLGLPGFGYFLKTTLSYLPNIFAAGIVIIIGIITSVPIASWLTQRAKANDMPYASALGNISKVLIITFSFVIGLSQLGFDISIISQFIIITLALFIGAGALAFGLGASQMVGHIIAMYYIKTHFQVGQQIQINGLNGQITDFIKHAVIVDTEQGRVVIPAKQFNEKSVVVI